MTTAKDAVSADGLTFSVAPAVATVGSGPSPNLRELTSLRFFAAFYVVLFHYHDYLDLSLDRYTDAIDKGYLGVDLFFILSGFILTRVYLDRWESGRFDYKSFLIARLSRIYPLHLAMLAVTVAIYMAAERIGATMGTGKDWGDFLPHVLMLHAWGFTEKHAWNFPSWSISAEWFAYLAFPVVLVVILRFRAWTGVAMAIALFLAAYAVVALSGHRLTALMYDYGIVRIAPEFLLGACLYRLYRKGDLRRDVASWLLAACVLGLGVALHHGVTDAVNVPLLAAIILLLGLIAKHGKPSFMTSRALVYLGEISYSTYMVHIVLIWIYTKAIGMGLGVIPRELSLWAWLPFWALLVAASVVSYQLVEKPARSLLRAYA